MPIPLDRPEDAEDVEIEVPLEPKNPKIVIISDDKDDESIIGIYEGVEPMLIDDYIKAEKDPDDTSYTPCIRSQPTDPPSSRLRSGMAHLPNSSLRMPIETPSSPEYSPIHSMEYTHETPSPEYTPASTSYTPVSLEYTPSISEYTPLSP